MRFSAHHITFTPNTGPEWRAYSSAGFTTRAGQRPRVVKRTIVDRRSVTRKVGNIVLLSSQTIIIIIVVLFGVGMPPTVYHDIVIYASRDNGRETGLRKELF